MLVLFKSEGQVEALADDESLALCALSHAPAQGVVALIPAVAGGNAQFQVLFFQQLRRLLQKHVTDSQNRLTVPLSEGLQLLQLAAKVEAYLLQLDFKVHLERGFQIGQRKMPVGVLFHPRAQLRNGFAGQRKANGMCVSAKTGEELAAIGLLQCLQQME